MSSLFWFAATLPAIALLLVPMQAQARKLDLSLLGQDASGENTYLDLNSVHDTSFSMFTSAGQEIKYTAECSSGQLRTVVRYQPIVINQMDPRSVDAVALRYVCHSIGAVGW